MQPNVIRVGSATVIILSILFSPFLIGGVSLLWKGLHIMQGLALCAAYFALLYWLCSPAVELLPRRLAFRTLFRRKEIDLTTVSNVSITANRSPTLVLHRQAGEPFSFIVKPFSKADVVRILQHIGNANPSARFDAISSDMRRSDFGSVSRLSARNALRAAFGTAAVIVLVSAIKLLLR